MKAITISLVAHLALVTTLTLASILAPGLLPNPRSVMLAFHDTARMVRLEDIELPTMKPTRSAKPAGTPSSLLTVTSLPAVIPLVAPTGITPESGAEPVGGTSRGGRSDTIETDAGPIAGDGIGRVETPPPPVETVPVRLHAGIDAPRKILDLAPTYPALARSSRVSGLVILEATIDVHGEVTGTRILRSVPLLDQAAVDAVRSWKYTPARLNGQPVAVLVTITVNFTLRE